jgi:hypothetical protein
MYEYYTSTVITARCQEDMQSSDKRSRRPSEEDCDIGSTESGMVFFRICARSVFLCTCVQLTIDDCMSS